jgi:predicted glycoside hydrolase/deacetylase ChbG (UPF0249 family)
MTACLVVNADDLGVSKGATLGIIKAHREGIVTSASLATTTPFYQHAVESAVRANPNLGIGLHFTLTSGKPVSKPSDVPLLINDRGFFRWRFLSLLAATSRSDGAKLLDQIEVELEAQIARLNQDGVHPDHIDGERHVQVIPGIFERVVDAAKRHGIPYVRAGIDVGPRAMKLSHVPGLALRGGFVKWGLLSVLSGKDRRHLGTDLRSADYVMSYLYTGRLDLMLRRIFETEPRDGVTEIMVHPGIPEGSRGLDADNEELEQYLLSDDRRKEMNACIDARGRTGKWKLTNFRRLAGQAAQRQ